MTTMETPNFEKYKEKFFAGWSSLQQKSGEGEVAEMGRERIVVFVVALILALCLWLMVNLSREYNLNIDLPIAVGVVPQDKALAEDLPEHATVSVSGEGWKLINLYNNPPSIRVDVSKPEINVYDQVQQQMNMLPNITVQKVQPLILNVQLEERMSRSVPVRPRVEVSFQEQYDFVSKPSIQPDSITVAGARSLVNNVTEWPTDSVHFRKVEGDLSRPVPLKNPGELISLSRQKVQYNARVSQFTEGEVKVDIRARNMPVGKGVSFSPSSITVKYNVPLEEYAEVQKIEPFNAYITYSQIQQDSSGFLTPQIEASTGKYHIEVRSFQPRRVAYFKILGNN